MPSDHRPSLGASKAQAALAKIISVISTVAPPLAALDSRASDGVRDSKAAAAVVLDLNLRLGPDIDGREPADDVGGRSSLVIDPAPPAAADSVGVSNVPKASDESISPAESVAGDARRAERSSEGECDPDEGEEGETKKEEEIYEIAYVNQQQQQKQRDGSSAKNKNGSGGYLDLLLEAVQHELAPVEHIEKEEEDDTKLDEKMGPPADGSKRVGSQPSSKRSREAAAFDFYEEEAAPLVRSYRGRKQTLPSRYRDSVIEPWAKPPTVNRHDGTGTSARVTGRRSMRRTTTPTT